MRLPQYVAEIERGEIDPRATPAVETLGRVRVLIDGNRSFGQVAAAAAIEVLAPIAREYGVALASVRRAGHAGRVGAYPTALARRGLVGVAFCSGPRSGHFVSPFGGREGRLATNPIAYGFPTLGEPVVADFATGAAPEGRIRLLRDTNMRAALDELLDARGQPTDDPNVLYATPAGTIRPLGGTSQGHKGSALGILVELLGTLVAGDDPTDGSRVGNNVTLVAIAVDGDFVERSQRFVDYIRSATPIDAERPVLMPGDRELATRERTGEDWVPVAPAVWAQIERLAGSLEVAPPLPRTG